MFDEGSILRTRGWWQSALAVKAYATARRLASRLGFHLVLKTYYSPIPDLDSLSADVWTRRDPLRGLTFDLERQLAFVETALSVHVRTFTVEATIDPHNSSYPLPDARILYAMVRHLKPQTIVELGSGQTTRIMAKACRDNVQAGVKSRLRVFDPFSTVSANTLRDIGQLERTKAQDTPDGVFSGLTHGDLVVVDSTHTVKLGGDVNHIILRILPLLPEGVAVHFHDISLPYEYSRYLSTQYALFWAEQYLLQAFLAFNSEFEILCALEALIRSYPDRMNEAAVASPGESGSSFWIRRRQTLRAHAGSV